MAYYTALQTAWALSSASPGALPSGVVGTSLYGLTTAQKLAAINAWTQTNTIPSTIYATGAQVANCINWAEFAALTAQQQQNVLLMCLQPGLLMGGSAQTSRLLPGMLVAYFPLAGPTIAALTAFASSQVLPWWQANSYTSPFTAPDLLNAGGLT